jgi:hypothetical protein
MTDQDRAEAMRLSEDVICIAQMMLGRGLNEEGHIALLDAALLLKRLAGLPMPWEAPSSLADRRHGSEVETS